MKDKMKIKKILLILLIILFYPVLYSFTQTELKTELTVTDALNRKVTFSQIPDRIVIAGRGAVMLADALYLFPEAAERIVALVKTDRGKGNFISVIDPYFNKKLIIDRNAGPEQISAADPDCVILKTYLSEDIGKLLEKIDIPVVYLDLENPDSFRKDIAVIGKLFNNKKRTDEILNYYNDLEGKISKKVMNIPEDKKPDALFLYFSVRDGKYTLNIPPVKWLQTKMIKMTGGLPVWQNTNIGKGWTKIGFEQIAAWDPDKIFIVSYKYDIDKVKKNIVSDSVWQKLRALKNGNLHSFPVDFFSWDQPDTRWILGCLWLAKKMHPDLFKEINIEDETAGFFKQMYKMNEKEYRINIKTILQGDIK